MVVLTTYTDENGKKHYITGKYDHFLKTVKTYSLFTENKKDRKSIKNGCKSKKSINKKK